MIKKIYLTTLLLVIFFGSFEVINASSISQQATNQQNVISTAPTLKPINKPNALPDAISAKANIMATNPPSPLPTKTILTPAPSIQKDLTEAEKFVFEKKQIEEKKAKDLDLEKKKKEEDKIRHAQQSSFINKLSSLDYKTQNPPKKLYDRTPSAFNKHIPPVYFKSYYISLIFKAAKKNDINGINAVLSKYNLLNGQNKDGDTVLMHAIEFNSLDAARLLLAKGAYIDAVNHRKRTALHYAATLGNLNIIKLLLSMGADYTLVDDNNLTAMDYAQRTQQEEAAKIISQYIEQNKHQ